MAIFEKRRRWQLFSQIGTHKENKFCNSSSITRRCNEKNSIEIFTKKRWNYACAGNCTFLYCIYSDYSAWSFLLSLLFENKQNHYYFLLKDILNCIKRATLCNSCNAWLFKVKVAITGILFVAFNALPDSLLHHFST